MKLTAIPVAIADLGHISQEQEQTRSVGLHVSEVIRYILLMSGLTKSNTFTEADLDMFASVGRLWEQLLSQSLFKPPRYQRPGEIEKDGIIGSPDTVDIDEARILEFKATWKSCDRDISGSDFWNWFIQIKAYCHMIGVNEAKLVAFFVNGNYRPTVPVMKIWDIEFSSGELRENWNLILRNAKEMKNETNR
jgi:hypothetical protein